MSRAEVIALIHYVAHEHKLDPIFYQAICMVESSLNPMAMRYEARWNYLFFPRENASRNQITEETEIQLQKFS